MVGVGDGGVGDGVGDGDGGGGDVVGAGAEVGDCVTDGDGEGDDGAGGDSSPASPCAIRKMPAPSMPSSTSATIASSTGSHHRRGG